MSSYTDVPAGVGIGTYSLSGAYGKKNLDEFREMLLCAVEKGVRFFDTSETYGDETEQFLGNTLKEMRKEIFLCTKVGMKGSKKPDLSYESVRQSCEKSLKNLLTEYIDLYMIHFDDPQTPVEETVQALSDLQSEGKIRHYGVSHLPINRIREYCERGNPYVVMAEFSAVSTAAKETVFPICRNNALKMIAFSVTGRGILTGSFDRERRFEHGDIRMMDPLFQREKLDCALAISEKMEELSRKIGVTRVQLAIAWVLSHSEVWIALTGPSTISHMMENVQAQRIKLEADLKKEINEAIREQQNSLRNKQEESVRNLVSSRLPADPSQALSDMVYAVETAIEIGKISEEQVIESVMTLLSMKDKASVRFREELEQLRLLLVKHLG